MLYVQERLGKDAKPFNIYKLRTMKKGSSVKFSQLVTLHGMSSYGKIPNDPRITRTGKFLRKYFIDEIPQIVNILKGDMKLVGVRASTEEFWSTHPEWFKKEALRYKPGLISLSYALKNPTPQRQLAYHRLYLREYKKKPFLTDVKFGARTLCGILNGNTSE